MIAGTETEIKLLASPARLAALRDDPLLAGSGRTVQLQATYFDTPDGRLRRAGASLRLRTGDGRCEQTLKRGGAAARRDEWSVEAHGDRPDPALFAAKAQAVLARLLGGEAVVAIATTTVERTIRQVRYGAALIEVAFDTGEIAADGRHQPVCELELELVEGDLADGLRLALALRPDGDLRWSFVAKAERCFALAAGLDPQAIRSGPVRLSRRMDAVAGLQAIGWNGIAQLLGNAPLVVSSGDSEAIHQCRVALRRLLSALSLFDSVIEGEGLRPLRTRLKALVAALGPARDLQVLIERVGSDSAGDVPVAHELAVLRDAQVAQVGTALAGADFQHVMLELALALETARAAGDGEPDDLPAFAAATLHHRQRKLHRAARHVRAMSDRELHRLRLVVKKLRYAVDFFGALGPTAAARTAAQAHAGVLGKLQDSLGALHDLATAKMGAAANGQAWFAGHDADQAARLQAELARRLGGSKHVRRALLRKTTRLLDQERASPRWWEIAALPASQETTMAHHEHDDGGHHGHHGHESYADQLEALQIELSRMQRHVLADQTRLLIILEGRDAAGKDGTIKRIVEHMSPRDTRVVALGVPNERERKAWYFQRWCNQLPVAGEIVLFNRSWYNRAGVERVMGFCTDEEYEAFMNTVVLFEQLLVHSGFTLIKYYLDISKAEQKRRLHDRERDPLKQWKTSPVDSKATKLWEDYSTARDAMLARTHSVFAPWVVVRADDKATARLAIIRDLLARCGVPEKGHKVLPDPSVAFVYDPVAHEKGWLAP